MREHTRINNTQLLRLQNKILKFHSVCKKIILKSDGIYIIDVSKGYESLLYKKVTAIEDSLMEDIIEKLAQIISHENKYFLKAQCAKYLQAADILYGLLI